MPDNVKIAKDFLEANGYVVLREKSYRQAQQRQRVAEARADWAEELRAGQDRWMREEVFPEERRLRERLTFVYGVARAHGATVEELSGVCEHGHGGVHQYIANPIIADPANIEPIVWVDCPGLVQVTTPEEQQ